MEPRIILSTTAKSRKHHKGSDTVATAWKKKGRPTIHVWKPKLFTRRVMEHELAHLKLGHSDKDVSVVRYCKDEVSAERLAAKAMGKDAEMDTFRVVNFANYFYLEWKENVPHYRKFFTNFHEYIKWGNESGFFKVCGFTDKEIGKLNRAMNRTNIGDKVYRVILDIKKGDEEKVFKQEVIADSKRDAYDMVSDNVPAVNGRWDVIKSRVERIK